MLDFEDRMRDWDAEADIMMAVNQKIIVHIGPALELGSGRVSRANKWQVLTHALMFLALEPSRDVERLSEMMVGTVSDFGVKAAVTQVGPTRLREVLPWFQVGVDEEAPEPPAPHECPEDDFADLPGLVDIVEAPPPPACPEDDFANLPGLVDIGEAPPPADPVIDLTACSDIPGMLHIVHNAGRGLEHQLQNTRRHPSACRWFRTSCGRRRQALA